MEKENIQILGVVDEDPYHYQTWSGSSRYLFNALKEKKTLYRALSAEPSGLVKARYKLKNFNPDFDSWKFKYHIDSGYYRQMTRAVRAEIARDCDLTAVDVLLQIGAWYDLTEIPDKLNTSYHDGNLATLLSSPYGHPEIPKKYISRTLKYEKELYQRMDLIFPMSEWLGRSFHKDFSVPESKIFPIGAGVNLDYIADVSGKSYEPPKLLMIGKDFERKGGAYLLEAFKQVRKSIPEATLTIVGPELKDLPEGVSCLGYISKESEEGTRQLLKLYSEHSVFVMPSLYEPFGIVFAEAMAHKLPCVGTDTCAMPEIIRDGETGFIVPVADATALAQALINLLLNPDLCQQMGEAGYRRYQSHYNWPSVVDKMLLAIEANS